MDTLIFATQNPHKVNEIRSVLQDRFLILSMKEAGLDTEIPEPFDNLEANASEKSTVIHRITGKNCFSEDTGLEVEALDGAPGVKSARYAEGDERFNDNTDKLLFHLKGRQDRKARFRTVISLILDNQEYFFEGICRGVITSEKKGNLGFGYDPVFIPEGSHLTFAEMNTEEKNKFSHRKKALEKMLEFLNNNNGQDQDTHAR